MQPLRTCGPGARDHEATTASIDALKAYSATRAPGFGGCDARIPLFERAVELDPELALAHAGLGVCDSGTGRRELAIQSATRAYELRQRTTHPERLFIEYAYDRDVTGDLERAFQTVTLWAQTYPRDLNAHGLRGGYSAHGTGRYEDVIRRSNCCRQAYAANGQHQQAVAKFQKILDHRGLMMGDPAGARALLEKARALARAGDRMGARAAYEDCRPFDDVQGRPRAKPFEPNPHAQARVR